MPGSAANAIVDNRFLSYSMFSSFPVCVRSGKWGIVQGLPIDDFRRAKIDASLAELKGRND
jgi:malate dehydrogenase